MLSSLASKWRKPILFTEIGYRNLNGANRRPWDWVLDGPANPEEQARSYQAAFEELWGQPWFAGMFWWEWLTRPDQGALTDTGYTPHTRPAEAVLKSWYGTQQAVAALQPLPVGDLRLQE
jgi:hypothetical protein